MTTPLGRLLVWAGRHVQEAEKGSETIAAAQHLGHAPLVGVHCGHAPRSPIGPAGVGPHLLGLQEAEEKGGGDDQLQPAPWPRPQWEGLVMTTPLERLLVLPGQGGASPTRNTESKGRRGGDHSCSTTHRPLPLVG